MNTNEILLQGEEKETFKKLKKRENVCFLAGAAAALIAFGSMGVIIWSGQKDVREKESIANKAGYATFNEFYKLEEQEKLIGDLENGIITIDEYKQMVKDIDDYEVEKFMQEYATAEELKRYEEVGKDDKLNFSALTIGGIGFAGALAATVVEMKNAQPLRDLEKKNEELIKKRDEEEEKEK